MAHSNTEGWKFRPTEQELINDYLYPMITGKAFPRNAIIMNCDLYGNKEPWEIWKLFRGSDDNHLYFFAPLSSSFVSPNIGFGRWSLVKSGTKIYGNDGRESSPIGMVKTFYYKNRGEPLQDRRWVMYEYSVDSSLLPPGIPHHNYAVCRIKKI